MPKLGGGCLCGAVRYEGEAEPVFMRACHCRECQHFSGSAFVTAMVVPRAALTITGRLATYTSGPDA